MNASDKMSSARIQMLLKQPFFGNMASRMPIVKVDSDSIKTMATDFTQVLYNEKFVDEMNVDNTHFCIAHEVLHCVFEHGLRRGSRMPKLWNIAADYAINGILVKNKIGTMPTHIELFHDIKYYDMTAEAIYDSLYEDIKSGKMSIASLEMLGELLDNHDFMEGYSEEEMEQMRREIRDRIISAMYSSGDSPEIIRGLVSNWNNVKYDLSAWVEETIVSTIKYDISFRYFDKKKTTDFIIPGADRLNQIDIAVAIDASGSIDNKTVEESMSAIKNVMDLYRAFNVTVFSFDTQVHNPVIFTPDNADEIDDYKVTGGGGTSFDAIWEYLKEHEKVPEILIILTDGIAENWGDPEYCDTAWVIKGTNRVPSHGVYLHYD